MSKSFVKKLLSRFGYAVLDTRKWYSGDGLFTLHTPRFLSEQGFAEAYNRGVRASGGVDPKFEWRIHTALWAASNALRAQGDFVECGVNAGFVSSAIMQRLDWAAQNRKFYLVDTFTGPILSQYSPAEVERGRATVAEAAKAAGGYVTDMERVRANFAQWPGAMVVQGAIPDVLPSLKITEVAFLHIDLNCAAPECDALEFFWGHLSSGGFVLLDDYAYLGHDCQGDAMDALARRLGTEILTLPTGQGLIVKD